MSIKNLEIDSEDIKVQKPESENDDDFSAAYRENLGNPLELTEDQELRIKKRLRDELKTWEIETSSLRSRLAGFVEFLDGYEEEEDYPFVGAVNIHIDLCGIFLKIYHSLARRSILGSNQIWYAEVEPEYEHLDQVVFDIGEMINFKAINEWNIREAISDAIYCAGRDRLCAVKVPYVEEYETVKDVIYVSNINELSEEFPDPLAQGFTQEKYFEVVEKLMSQEVSELTPLEIPIEYEKSTYIGPKAYIVERSNFVFFPSTAISLEKEYCRGFGNKFAISRNEIKRKSSQGVWYKEAVDRFLQKTKKKGDDPDLYVTTKERTVDSSRSGNSETYYFYEIVYYMKLGEKFEKKYILTYSLEHDELVSAIEYPYRVNFYALFRNEHRPNQMDGRSIVEQLEALSEEMDMIHNQRIQSRQITNVPSFKMKKGRNKDFDPLDERNRWGPGVIFRLDEPEFFEQFKIQPVDLGESLAEEANNLKIASLIIGVDVNAFSGMASSVDPEAPGNKTALLINQSNMRMEDMLNELRFGVEAIGEICLSHLYQFGTPQIGFIVKDNSNLQSRKVQKRFLRSGIKLKMKGISVTSNPDSEFMKYYNMYRALIQEPLIGQDPRKRIAILKKAVYGSRIDNADEVIPNEQDIAKREQQEQALRQQAAMMAAQKRQQEQGMTAAKVQVEQEKQKTEQIKAQTDRQSAENDLVKGVFGV